MVEGIFPPIITIFNENGDIDYEANKKMTDFLINKGVDGITYLGTSGEFSSLTMKERKEYLEIMVKYVNNRVKIIAGINDTNINNVKDLIALSEDLSVDAGLLVPPYFNKNNDDMIYEYYTDITSSCNLPIILYNIPDLSGYNFTYNTIKKLVEKNPNIIGIKESINDIEHLKEIMQIKDIKYNFKVFCAYENLAEEALVCGADGFINATANFAPEYTVKTYQHFKNNDNSIFKENAQKMKDAMRIYDISNPLYLACKEACYIRVINKECFERLPSISLSKKSKDKVKECLERLNILN